MAMSDGDHEYRDIPQGHKKMSAKQRMMAMRKCKDCGKAKKDCTC